MRPPQLRPSERVTYKAKVYTVIDKPRLVGFSCVVDIMDLDGDELTAPADEVTSLDIEQS